jgi:hypothetical protein
MAVTCGPRGKVHDYVTFYFCGRTPMLLSILKSGQFRESDFIFFAISMGRLNSNRFVFTNKAANRRFEPPTFYDATSNLTELNWPEILNKKWTPENNTLKYNLKYSINTG